MPDHTEMQTPSAQNEPIESAPQPTARQAAADFWGQPIFQYTRAQAIDDGVLVDVTDAARQMGFKLPVAMSAAAWTEMVKWTENDSQCQVPQDESGRLMDVLWMGYLSALRSKGLSFLSYDLHVVPRDGKSQHPRRQTLTLHIGPGDTGEAVLTIMLPGED